MYTHVYDACLFTLYVLKNWLWCNIFTGIGNKYVANENIVIHYLLATEVASNKKNNPSSSLPLKVRSFAKKMDDASMYDCTNISVIICVFRFLSVHL